MFLTNLLNPVKAFLTSPLRIGALEVSTTAIKYLLIRGNTIVQASLRLPPGVIERGTIKNRAVFVEALKNLHAQITPKPRPINVILTVPSNLVFAQSFNVPIVAKENLAESIKLNLQMISPNKIEDSYYDYQEIKLNKDLGHLELLGAFTSATPINEFQSALEEADFVPISVEFPGLSLARLIFQRWGGIELEQNYLLIYVSSEGVLMMILKNGNLAFNHFTSWEAAGQNGASFTFEQVKDIIKREMQRVMNFYLSRSGKVLTEAILISPVFNYEIVKMASEELKIKIRNLTIAELPKLQPSWFPVLGAGLRGLVSRSKDTDISLAATGSQTEYYQERALNFIGLWRNILIGTLVLVLAAFATTDTLFYKQQTQLTDRLENTFDSATLKNSALVREKIANFNALLDTIEATSNKENVWSPILDSVVDVAETSISLDRVFVGKTDSRGVISGKGSSEEAVLAFKDRLLANSYFADAALPLSNIKTASDGSASFNMNVTLKPKTTTE